MNNNVRIALRLIFGEQALAGIDNLARELENAERKGWTEGYAEGYADGRTAEAALMDDLLDGRAKVNAQVEGFAVSDWHPEAQSCQSTTIDSPFAAQPSDDGLDLVAKALEAK